MLAPAGKNDNHRLLPLQVQQHLEVEDGLRGTNGMMLAVLLDNPRYDTLEAGQVSGQGSAAGICTVAELFLLGECS